MIIECVYCEGKGKPPGLGLDGVCSVCEGNRNIKVPADNCSCNYCKGTGHEKGRKYSNICKACSGHGVVSI